MLQPRIVRTPIEVTRYHDILDMVLRGEVPTTINDSGQETYREQLTTIKLVFCWLLGHDGQSWLTENMKRLEDGIKELGYTLNRTQ